MYSVQLVMYRAHPTSLHLARTGKKRNRCDTQLRLYCAPCSLMEPWSIDLKFRCQCKLRHSSPWNASISAHLSTSANFSSLPPLVIRLWR